VDFIFLERGRACWGASLLVRNWFGSWELACGGFYFLADLGEFDYLIEQRVLSFGVVLREVRSWHVRGAVLR
jgi:hypothetical protein